MSTYRERREAKAERLREWAEGREAKANAARAGAERVSDMIPMGQPILVGHHSEGRHRRDLKRIDAGFQASAENSAKASDFRSRAANIEAAADRAIYDDDPDAVERLTEKLAALEAKRERMKAANAEYRKANRDALKAMHPYDRHQAVPFPSYTISNIGGVITTTRKRLESLKQPETGRWLNARRPGECRTCGAATKAGDRVRYFKRSNAVECESCAGESR